MKIGHPETIRLLEFPNIIWLRVHGPDGLHGVGETVRAPETVETYLHEIVAPRVLGDDPLAVAATAARLYGHLGYRSSGVQTRSTLALDLLPDIAERPDAVVRESKPQ